MSIPSITLGAAGMPVHFLHANGYPPECYLPLISRLSVHYQVICMRQRPLWPDSKPEEIEDWHPLTDDFLRFLDEHPTGRSIAIGHSVGGIVVLRAALSQPERFQALVLIDPVLFPTYVIRFWQVVRTFGLGYQLHPLVRASKNRRRQFDDLDRLFNRYRRKPIFRYMDDEALRAYVKGIACPCVGGYTLCYSVEWEMRIYVTSLWHDMDIWRALPGLKIPLLIIRGAETNTLWASTTHRMQQKVPSAQIVTVPQATHLVPLEHPAEVYQAIQGFLQENI